VEGLRPAHHRGFLPAWVLIAAAALGLAVTVSWTTPALAGNTESQNATTASATVSGGTITLKAGVASWTPSAGSPWGKRAQPDPPGRPNPNQPYGCTYFVPTATYQQLMGTAGPMPGKWVIPACAGPGAIDPMPPIWVVNPKTQALPASPAVLARQALSKLALPVPVIEMAPPADREQLVNVATWLWIDPVAWRGMSAAASAGPVTATAHATPAEVLWSMGDGQLVTCLGPGTPYDPAAPAATTACSYTWTKSSAAQPGGAYQVTATVYYEATWAAAGAPGGGSLGLLPGPSAHVAVRVAQSEAINTTPR
jgi:hypothetical protein